MVYRRRRAQRRPSKFRKFVKGYLPRKVYQIGRSVQYLKKAINVEYKDFVHNGTITPSSTGDVRGIGGIDIDTGDTSATRDGRSIKLTSWFFRMYVLNNSSFNNTVFRMLLVHDKQVNGALPAASDILETVSTTGLMNRDNADRFTVLSDKLFHMNTNYSGQTVALLPKPIYKSLDMHIKYSGTGGGIADLTSNELILLTISNQAVNTPSITYRARVKYIDN